VIRSPIGRLAHGPPVLLARIAQVSLMIKECPMTMSSVFKLLAIAGVAACLASCSTGVPETVGTAAGVQTSSGIVMGASGPEQTLVFKDIPFAKPPVGEGRWSAPQPIHQPDAVILPKSEMVMCPQPQSMASGTDGGDYLGSEDCLYLDVYAPAVIEDKSLPVMLWIHGGSNLTGHKGTYDFSRLAARQQVVVVVINYRLGPFGWFVHPALNGSSLSESPLANFGTLDMIEALKWTQHNVAAFGGDKHNVTVFGESAGGRNVYSLLASPLTSGLFHKAIAQSGHVRSLTPEEAFNAGKQWPVDRGSWEVLGALALDNNTATAADLRGVDATQLLRAYYELEEDHIQPAVIADGVVIPREGLLAALSDPKYAKRIPVMAGTTRDEVTLWVGLNRYFVDISYPFSRLLPARMRIKDPALYDFWVDSRSRGWKLSAVDLPLAAMHSAGYEALYAYRFDWDEQPDNYFVAFSQILGASHASEIAFLMGAPMYGAIGDYMYPDTPSAEEMTLVMMTAWGRFAHEGAPELPRALEWPQYAPEAPAFMRLDTGADLGISDDVLSREVLLDRVAETALLNELEKCLLVWELVTAVGLPDYEAYVDWQGGRCATVDAPTEKRRIRAALEAEYGDAYYSG